jgi:hypothetical protein
LPPQLALGAHAHLRLVLCILCSAAPRHLQLLPLPLQLRCPFPPTAFQLLPSFGELLL